MRTFILIIICSLFICSVAHAQGQTYSRWRDATDKTIVANVTAAGATFANTKVGGHVLGSMYIYDGANWDAWTATSWGDALSAGQQGADVLAYMVGYDSSGVVGRRVRVDGSGYLMVNQTTSIPGYGRMQDGDSTVLADVLDTLSTGQSANLNGVWTAAALYGYNGATFDMVKVSATDALMVNQENFPLAYDEGNAWVNSRKASIATYSPAKEEVTTTASTATTTLAAKEILGYPNVTVYLKNADASAHLVDADIMVSPNGSDWISLTWTACDTLQDGEACVYQLTNSSYRYVKVQVTDDGNAADMEAWLTANLN